MEKYLFRNSFMSYFFIAVLGITAGLFVAFFSTFPAEGLWGFSLFSSTTIGFWMFSVSLIVLFSLQNYNAAINATTFVYLMFLITGISKQFTLIKKGYIEPMNLIDICRKTLFYGLIPALVCGVLGFILWYGRKKNVLSIILRFAPALVIAVEAVILLIKVIVERQALFMMLVDMVCCLCYVLIICRFSKKKLQQPKQINS